METNKYFLPMSVLAAGLLIAGAVFWNGKNTSPAAPTGGESAGKTANINDVKTDGYPFIGNANAPVTIAFWSDFQCPFCKAFEVGHSQIPTPSALPEIIKDYVDTGKVKIVFKDVVFLSPRAGMDSLTGALYGQSVWKLYPQKYFEWRTAMFNAQDDEGSGFGNAESIDKMNATIVGLDSVKIAEDVKANTDTYTQFANATTAEAQKLGVTATPSVILGTQLIAGAYPYDKFKAAIDTVIK